MASFLLFRVAQERVWVRNASPGREGWLVAIQHLRALQLRGSRAAEAAWCRYCYVRVSGINWKAFQHRWGIPPIFREMYKTE